MERFERKEYKYYVPGALLASLRERVQNHMVHDPFCRNHPANRYVVRSIYLDTDNLLFYYEKMDGQKYRKKLRVRVYDDLTEESIAFLEIKRKVDDTILKERALIDWPEAFKLGNGADIQLAKDRGETEAGRITRDRFIYLTKRLLLEPKALITYEREAFMDEENPDLRITFDMNVRSYYQPTFEQMFEEKDLRAFSDPYFILEVKFSTVLPLWMREVIRDYRLHQQSISKYCLGLDSWQDYTSKMDQA
ncbi:polyphosphate polymerase domain-containing protein [bacterium]|nr:polyphosphate polymerase domain-containing protein [bacterium]